MSTPSKRHLVKIQLEDDIRRVSIAPDQLSFQGLLRTIKSLFNEIPSGCTNLSLKYVDVEEEMCSITSDEELLESVRSHRLPMLKIFVSFEASQCIAQRAPAPHSPACSTPVAVVSSRDKISLADFNEARTALESLLHDLRGRRQPRVHVSTPDVAMDPIHFKKAKLMLSGFIATNPRAFKKPSPLAQAQNTVQTNASSAVSGPSLGAVAFEQCRRVVRPHAVRHVQLQKSIVLGEAVNAYASMYSDENCPTKNWCKKVFVDYAKTPCVEYMSSFVVDRPLPSASPKTFPRESKPSKDRVAEYHSVVRSDQEQWYLLALNRLGFVDAEKNRAALQKTQFNLATAIEILLAGAH